MTPAHSLLAVLLCAATVDDGARVPDPTLTIGFAPYQVLFHVTGSPTPFFGAILGSLEPDLSHYLTGLPPLLTNHVVLDMGIGDAVAGYTAVFPELLLPPGIAIYVQGVLLNENGLQSTGVEEFTLDVTAPPR